MRRTALLLASMGLVVLLASGVALAAVVNCVAGEDFCVGTKNDDTLNGSEEREEIYGLSGDDLLNGNGGDDEFFGGQGVDTIRGGNGFDTIGDEEAGADKIYGEADADNLIDMSVHRDRRGRIVADKNLISGGAGNDYLGGGTRLYGGDGNDTLDGFSSIRTKRPARIIDGGSGEDEISSSLKAPVTVYAQDGEHDTISCGTGPDDVVYYDAGIDSVNPATCERRITKPPPE